MATKAKSETSPGQEKPGKGIVSNPKKKIILIHPKVFELYTVTYLPFGALFIGSALKKSGYEPIIFDERKRPISELFGLIDDDTLMVCITTIMTGPSIRSGLGISKSIKEKHPDLPIVWGGPHVTILARETAENKYVDIVGKGEGERIVVNLANALNEKKDLSTVKGIVYKKKGKVMENEDECYIFDWGNEVFYDFSLIDLDDYIFTQNGEKAIHIITSRGCPFRCSFCWNLLVNKRSWRHWKIEDIEKNIQPFIEKGVKCIYFNDDFIGPEERAIQIGNLMKKHGMRWGLENGCRVDVHKSERFFKAMKDTKCHHLSYGAESGSPEFLKKIDKDTSIDQIKNISRMGQKYGVGIKYGWMAGMPGETKEDVLKTVRLIKELQKRDPITSHSISLFNPYPGTKMYEEAIRYGWKPPTKLEEWGDFREEMSYPYLKDIWWYKAVVFCAYFQYGVDNPYAVWKKTKWYLKVPFKILGIMARLRWRSEFFSFPIEYMVSIRVWGIIKRLSQR